MHMYAIIYLPFNLTLSDENLRLTFYIANPLIIKINAMQAYINSFNVIHVTLSIASWKSSSCAFLYFIISISNANNWCGII